MSYAVHHGEGFVHVAGLLLFWLHLPSVVWSIILLNLGMMGILSSDMAALHLSQAIAHRHSLYYSQQLGNVEQNQPMQRLRPDGQSVRTVCKPDEGNHVPLRVSRCSRGTL